MPTHEPPTPKPFQLVAGHVALDLANTLDYRSRESGPEELLSTYDELLRFATQSELLTERQARKLKRAEASQSDRSEVLDQVRELRESIAAVAYAQLEADAIPDTNPDTNLAAHLAILEKHFQQAASHRHLVADRLQLAWGWRGLGRQIAAPLWLLSQAAADLLLSDEFTHLRCCASDNCRWLFLDTSKNHTRRWCEMKTCGNRMKAKRFQARQSDNP